MNRIAGRKLIVSREPNSLKPSSMRSVKRWKRKSLCSKRMLIVRAQMTLLDAMARTGPRSVGAPSRRHRVFRRVSTSSCKTIKHRVKSSIHIHTRGKAGKAVPLQACSGPEVSRKLRFPHYMTTAQDGGKVVSPTHRPPLPPVNVPGTHFC